MEKSQKATLREHDLTPEGWGVMTARRPSWVNARTSSVCAPGATVEGSHVVAHGSVVAVAITVPSTANCTRATGQIVWARQSTTPLTVWPSARFWAVTWGAGRGLGFGFGLVTTWFVTTTGRRRFAARASAATAASVIQCRPSRTVREVQRTAYRAGRSRLTARP